MAAEFWAGLRFHVLHHREGRMLRTSGLFAFVRGDDDKGPLILFAGEAEDLAQTAGPGHRLWSEALALGLNELHVHFPVPRRIDRVQLVSRIVRHLQPVLNVIDDATPLRAARPLRQVG